MKVKASERFFLVAFLFIVLTLLVLFVLTAWNVLSAQSIADFIKAVQNDVFYVAAATAVIVLLVIYAVSLMFIATKKSAPTNTLIKVTENGSIRVTLQTVTALAVKTARSLSGVKDVKIITDATPEGVVLFVRVAVVNDAVIPELTGELQKVLKENIETVAGLQVKDVPVLVDNSIIATGN